MKKKRDILFLCQFFYPEYVSSATLPFDTAVALKKAGYSVDALCGYPKEYTEAENIPLREEAEGIRIRRVKYIQLGRKSFLGRLVNYFSFTFMMLLHLFEMAKYKAVVVYSNPPILPWVASWAKLLFKTKLIFVAYDLYPEIAVQTDTLRQGNIICRLMDHINQCVYKRADAVIALSSEMKEYIAAHRPIEKEKIHVIPNWYAEQPESSGEEENTFSSLTNGRFTVAYFGNMGIAQDMETILSAMRILKEDPGICFLFAGHGNKMPLLEQTIREEKIENAYLLPFLKGKEFRDAQRIADCALVSLAPGLTGLCVPSKTYSYMAQGLPLLAIMDDCDIVQDIRAGAGARVRNGEGEALAQAIRQLQADPAKTASMRKTCKEIFLNHYTRSVCTRKYVDFFGVLLNERVENR